MSGGSKIFIGNIPYGVTDEVIVEILGRAGQVLNFRAMTDKETGKPKGYGFAEYSDADAALSAVRNLNDFELQGRKLRVDYANEKDSAHSGAHQQHSAGQSATTHTPDVPGTDSRLPQLPTGVDLAANLTAEDAISKTLNTLPVTQLLDILVQMQSMVLNDPIQAQQLLEKSPQLSYAIFQALLQLKLVDPSNLNSIIQQATAAPAQPTPAYQPPPSATPMIPQPAYGAQPPQYGQYPPPQTHQAPPPPQPAPAAQGSREAAIQQLLSMTQEQIDALSPNDRQQIMALRAQFLAQYR